MPGMRAEGVRPRGIPLHEDLWSAAAARAKQDGVSLVEAVRALLQAYTDGRIDLPEPASADRPASN